MFLSRKYSLIIAIISGVIILISLFWCINLRDPYLFSVRAYETFLIVVVASVAGTLVSVIRYRSVKKLIQLSSVMMILVVMSIDIRFYLWKNSLLQSPSSKAKAINRRLIVGFDSFVQAKVLAQNEIAGFFITTRNISGFTFAQLRSRLSQLQAIRRQAGLPPLIMATDQEGGVVSRLTPPLTLRPPLFSLTEKKDTQALAYNYGIEQGRELRSLGITLNFSPVVDLKPARPPSLLDRHTQIITRAISDDPLEVAKVAQSYVKGLEEQGVTAVLKHFPGLRKVPEDTHYFSGYLNASPETLIDHDWIPFIQVSQNTDAWMMLSHVILTRVDPDLPVSMSKKVIQKILRTQLSYKGVLVTDDLTMRAAYDRGFCHSVVTSFNADVDYLLIAYDHEKYFDAVRCLVNHSP
jgi:beta-N-acetylhexosaminidase